MRLSYITGIVLIIAGLIVLVRGGTFTTRKNVIDVGDLQVSATERTRIQPWIAGLAMLAGTVLIVTAARRKA